MPLTMAKPGDKVVIKKITGKDEVRQHLAELVIASVCEAVGRPVRSANPGDYFVIRESPAPSVLVECGFLSNAEDEALLQTEEHQQKLVRGIEKRLDADAPVGFLLSGGLDSSLVCAVAAKCLQKPIRTFAIGMRADAIDLKYAREVADYIHSDHTEIIITEDKFLFRSGVGSTVNVMLPLNEIRYIDVRQNALQLLLGYGKIKVITDGEEPFVIRNLVRPERFARRIMRQCSYVREGAGTRLQLAVSGRRR